MFFRFSLLLFLLFYFNIFAAAQTGGQIAETTCYMYQVVEGKSYIVSATTDSAADIAIGVGFDPLLPMSVINSSGTGLSETYRLEADSRELQACVYLNKTGAGHSLVVLDEDQLFPFLKWRDKSTVYLETSPEGIITSFKFNWKRHDPVVSNASRDIQKPQTVAARSGISYSFRVTPGVPIDVLVVPESNHLDLSLHTVNGETFETVDNNRSAENLNDTDKGQIEWMQIYPERDRIEFLVENKSFFGGSYRMVVRRLDKRGDSFRPITWVPLIPSEFESLLAFKRSKFPSINLEQAVTYEITPARTTESYSFGAAAFEAGLDFALLVRTDPAKPPLFVQAGGEKSSVIFKWQIVAGEVYFLNGEDGKSEKHAGFPSRGKLQVSIVAFKGNGRVAVTLEDAESLRKLDIPDPKLARRDGLISLLSNKYEGYGVISSNFTLYRYRATPDKSYNVKVIPDNYFDAAILDPSKRTPEKPGALGLVDENGRGAAEQLKLVATTDFIEFAVAGIRYVNGIVASENKRLGGTGFFRIDVKGSEGSSPELIETVRIDLPNEFVSKEIGIEYQPWDDFAPREASELPPIPSGYDRRIIDALGTLLEPVPKTGQTNGTQVQ